MKFTPIFVILCLWAAIASADLFGHIRAVQEKYWEQQYYLKYYTPSGKTFYIDFFHSDILLGVKSLVPPPPPPPLPVEIPLNEEEKLLPFISFVSVDLRIYDIYFDNDDQGHVPRLEKSSSVYEFESPLIRHQFHSFVGPDKKVYEINYDDAYELTITDTSKTSDNYQIKSFGPYGKWEHIYDFSEDGEIVLDHTITPVPVLPNRSIVLPELEAKTEYVTVVARFNSPAGTKYRIDAQVDIVRTRNGDVDDTSYITFTEPNGQMYQIQIDAVDGHATLVEASKNENYFADTTLYSFVAPNGVLYKIDRGDENDPTVPVLVSHPNDSSDLRITFSLRGKFYEKRVTYTFSDNGMKLFDREDVVDYTLLDEQPSIPVAEVTDPDYTVDKPFLILYTPSGNNYHVFANETTPSIAVEKGSSSPSQLYITFFNADGRKTNIYYQKGSHPYAEDDPNNESSQQNKNVVQFELSSFTTPDHKEYEVREKLNNANEWTYYVEDNFASEQVEDPIDKIPQGALSIKLRNKQTKYGNVYSFTWNGDKLIKVALTPPIFSADVKVLKSLIGK